MAFQKTLLLNPFLAFLKYLFVLCTGLNLTTSVSMAELRLPRLISNGMVLQRDSEVKIWGWASPGEEVSVEFLGSEYDSITKELKEMLEFTRNEINETDKNYPHIQEIIDSHWND